MFCFRAQLVLEFEYLQCVPVHNTMTKWTYGSHLGPSQMNMKDLMQVTASIVLGNFTSFFSFELVVISILCLRSIKLEHDNFTQDNKLEHLISSFTIC